MDDFESYANLDFAREQRCGFPEVVYGAGKTAEQVCGIMAALAQAHQVALCTRATPTQAAALQALEPDAQYVASAGILYIDRRDEPLRMSGQDANTALSAVHPVLQGVQPAGNVVVACAGTSDLPVAQEAALTARLMGSQVALLHDIGVSGLHRALQHTAQLQSARAIVVVAGMEGALPSLIGGLVDVPVIAVPTSVGYGASFGGIAALLGMLNSCAGGVSVVNIDNGYGAGVIAHRINIVPARFQ